VPAPSLATLLSTARDNWVKKLIDPSRNNGLLFFRDLKVSMLELPVASPCLKKLLAQQNHEWQASLEGLLQSALDGEGQLQCAAAAGSATGSRDRLTEPNQGALKANGLH
jgi:hypothetical protein